MRRSPVVVYAPAEEAPEPGSAEALRFRVGYWYDANDEWAKYYPEPRDFVDPTWDPAERRRVIRYLKRAELGPGYPGYAHCRFDCGIPPEKMGDRDMSDGLYMFPQGYVHYLAKHNVKPPEEFLEHVRRQLAQRPLPRLRRAIGSLFSRGTR